MTRTTILKIARRAAAFHVARRRMRRALRILCYHGIWLGSGHHGNYLFMDPAKFERRIRFLASSGYRVLTLDAALRRLREGSLPADAVVITIDDGWQSTYTHMLPVLSELSLPATVYVTSYHVEHQTPVVDPAVAYMLEKFRGGTLDLRGIGPAVDGTHVVETPDQRETLAERLAEVINEAPRDDRYRLCELVGRSVGVAFEEIAEKKLFHLMTRDQIRDAAARGFDIQLHTHRHRMADGAGDSLARELADNRASLEPLTGRPMHHFCYPSGRYSEACFPTLQLNGVRSATTTQAGLAFAWSHPYALPRILDGQQIGELEFEAEMSGFFELVRTARRWSPARVPHGPVHPPKVSR
jgi:peptidoglycan/xylan/chitin deacetylase (PgdA/CDA1 family)